MRSRHPKSEPVNTAPDMMRGETEFEEARIRCEFELIFAQMSAGYFTSFKEGCEFLARKVYFTGKAAGKRESLGSPSTETLKPSPSDASVRETAGAIKEQTDGITTSD